MAKLRLNEVAEQKGLNISQLQRKSGLTMGMIRRYWYMKGVRLTMETEAPAPLPTAGGMATPN